VGRVGAVHDIGVEDAAVVFLAEALKDALRAAAFDAHLNARVFGLEGLLHLLGDLDIHGRIEGDQPFRRRLVEKPGFGAASGALRRRQGGSRSRHDHRGAGRP
jgi:hypothetical protein